MAPEGIGSPVIVVDGLPKCLEEHGWKPMKFRQAEMISHGSLRGHSVNPKGRNPDCVNSKVETLTVRTKNKGELTEPNLLTNKEKHE